VVLTTVSVEKGEDMIGEAIRAELRRPLEGDRRFVHTTQVASWDRAGYFVVRHHPEHIAAVLAEKARIRVQEDVAAYRRLLTLERNMRLFG
jgi:ribosome biogenesis protein Nip4